MFIEVPHQALFLQMPKWMVVKTTVLLVCVRSPDSPITFTIEVPADGSSLICVDYKLLLLGHSEGISQIPEAVCAPKT